MKVMAHMHVKIHPERKIFAKSAISTAWNVTQDAVKLEVGPL